MSRNQFLLIKPWGDLEKALRHYGLDYISMARPFIREPDLALRWKQGNTSPAKYISCNGCFRPGLKEGGIAENSDKVFFNFLGTM